MMAKYQSCEVGLKALILDDHVTWRLGLAWRGTKRVFRLSSVESYSTLSVCYSIVLRGVRRETQVYIITPATIPGIMIVALKS